MDTDTAVWTVILLALVAANLPFLSERLLMVWRMAGGKSLWWRLLELAVFYFVVGGIGLALEKHLGQIAPQGWEFYAITASLFLTLAFPGFVYRHLAQRRA
jgi:hypothetical protein